MNTTTRKLKHNCPECLASFQFKEQLAGKAVKCPKCNKPIRLPGLDPTKSINKPKSAGTVSPADTTGTNIAWIRYVVIGAILLSVVAFAVYLNTTILSKDSKSNQSDQLETVQAETAQPESVEEVRATVIENLTRKRLEAELEKKRATYFVDNVHRYYHGRNQTALGILDAFTQMESRKVEDVEKIIRQIDSALANPNLDRVPEIASVNSQWDFDYKNGVKKISADIQRPVAQAVHLCGLSWLNELVNMRDAESDSGRFDFMDQLVRSRLEYWEEFSKEFESK